MDLIRLNNTNMTDEFFFWTPLLGSPSHIRALHLFAEELFVRFFFFYILYQLSTNKLKRFGFYGKSLHWSEASHFLIRCNEAWNYGKHTKLKDINI